MALITATNISLSNHVGPLFIDASFSIEEGDRVGLVGNNGSGKSTLLRCLIGQENVESGSISRKKQLQIGVVEQTLPPGLADLTLYEVIEQALPEEERDWAQYRVDMALEALGASEETQLTQIKNLSGGWQRLTLIARTNMANPDLLILDEPTNHLDIGKVLHLERWLRDTVTAPYVIVSHDRRFLDEVTTSTMILRGGRISTYRQPYSKAAENLAAEDQFAARQRKVQEREIDRLNAQAAKFREQAKGHGSERLSRTAQNIFTRTERMSDALPEVFSEADRLIELRERELGSNQPLLKIENVDVSAPVGRKLFHIDYLALKKGDRVALLGENGSGKSMLINRVWSKYQTFKEDPRSYVPEGITFNSQLEIGFVDQQLSLLPEQLTLLEFLRREFVLDYTAGISALARAGFERHQQDTPIGTLSFGERARLAFAALRNQRPNAFLLDEPTNHLDISGQDFLASSIWHIDAPCLIISHDRAFVDEIATRYVEIRNGSLIEVDSPNKFYDRVASSIDNFGATVDTAPTLQAPFEPRASTKGFSLGL